MAEFCRGANAKTTSGAKSEHHSRAAAWSSAVSPMSSCRPSSLRTSRAAPKRAAGPLFPYLCTVRAGDRATEFKQRCDGLGISGVSLHSYRYAWAKRALKCGLPERFAQQALGHNSKAVHRAYAKHAEVTVPSLADWEKDWQENPQRNTQPKSLPLDFRSQLTITSQAN